MDFLTDVMSLLTGDVEFRVTYRKQQAERAQLEAMVGQFLDHHGFDSIVQKDMYSSSPLHRACTNKTDPDHYNVQDLSSPTRFFSDPARQIQLVRYLLERGGHHQLNSKDSNGWTPLHHALCSAPLVHILVGEYGANINATDYSGQTALHMIGRDHVWGNASERTGDVEVIGILLDHRADKEARDFEGWTPLLRACREGNTAIAKVLVERGANVRCRASEGRTPMHLLLQAQKGAAGPCTDVSETISTLLQHGADVNAEDIYGFTPLHHATLGGNGKYVRTLLDHGANVRAVTNDNHMTPLLLATHHDQFDAFQALLETSDISAANLAGDTILHLATTVPMAQCIIESCVSHSVSDRARLFMTKNHAGLTPLEVAKNRLAEGPDVWRAKSAQLKAYLESFTDVPLAVVSGAETMDDGMEEKFSNEHSVKLNPNLSRFQRGITDNVFHMLSQTDVHPVAYVIMGYLSPVDAMMAH